MASSTLHNRDGIIRLVDLFYEKVKVDDLLAPLFAHVKWDKHLPRMYDFWEQVLFYSGTYNGNPIQTHISFHQRQPLNAAQFNRWLQLFQSTVDELFSGEMAETAKQRAHSLATVMQIKLSIVPAIQPKQ